MKSPDQEAPPAAPYGRSASARRRVFFRIGAALIAFTTPVLLFLAWVSDDATGVRLYLVFCAVAPVLLMIDAHRRISAEDRT